MRLHRRHLHRHSCRHGPRRHSTAKALRPTGLRPIARPQLVQNHVDICRQLALLLGFLPGLERQPRSGSKPGITVFLTYIASIGTTPVVVGHVAAVGGVPPPLLITIVSHREGLAKDFLSVSILSQKLQLRQHRISWNFKLPSMSSS